MTAGFSKLLYTRRKLRHYADQAASQPASVTVETPFRVDIEANRDERVPFGVRALESGIEVDGVWISPSNSTRSSRDSSPSPSPTQPRSKFSSGYSQPSLLRHELRGNTTTIPSRSSVLTGSNAFKYAIGAERIPSSTSLISTNTLRLPSSCSLISTSSLLSAETRTARPERHLRGRSLPRDLPFLDMDLSPPAAPLQGGREMPGKYIVGSQYSASLWRDYIEVLLITTELGTYHHSRANARFSLPRNTQNNFAAVTRSSSVIKSPPPGNVPEEPALARISLSEQLRLHQAASHGQLISRFSVLAGSSNKQVEPHGNPSHLARSFALHVPSAHGPVATGLHISQERASQQDADIAEAHMMDGDNTTNTSTGTEIPDRHPQQLWKTLQNFSVGRDPELQILRQVNTGFTVLRPGSLAPIAPQVTEEINLEDILDRESTKTRRPHKLQKKQRQSSLRQKFSLVHRHSLSDQVTTTTQSS